jgi:Domain of unknown function (DUF1735)
MKNIKFTVFLIILFVTVSTGCLKDKGFENNEYGISDPDNTPKGLGFPLGANQSNTIGLNAVSSTNQVINDIIVVNLFDGTLPTSDVKVNLAIDNSIIAAYNTANSTDIKIFNPSRYSIPSLTLTVPAGQRLGQLPINIPSTVPLNLDSSYAIGLKIVSNDGGYNIPSRTEKLLLVFNLKNKYDGVYKVTGTFLDVTNATFTDKYPLEYELATTGPNSVDVKTLINGEKVPGYVFSAGGTSSFFGNWGLTMTFDPATNAISDLHNYYGDPTKATTGVGTPSGGSGPPNYSASNSRRAILDPTGVNAYDPNTKNVKIKYFMIQPTSAAGSNPRCMFSETWTYVKPRG